MLSYYRLDENGIPIQELDKIEWAKWVETFQPLLAQTYLGNVGIRTTFIGFSSKEPPELWQTEIRGGLLDSQTFMASGTREDAEKNHNEVVSMVKRFLEKNQKPQIQ